MAPSATLDSAQAPTKESVGEKLAESDKTAEGLSDVRKPLKYSGTLDSYPSFDPTPVIGREFPDAQLSEILKDDAKIRDLGITSELPVYQCNRTNFQLTSLLSVSQRGVVFFRNQDLNVQQQKVLGQKLGELTGKPATSKAIFQGHRR
jgi:hypothetical protein